MKILIIGKFYPPTWGGIETHVRDLALAMNPHHEVRVLVHNVAGDTVRESVEGVDVVRVGTPFSPLNQPISPSMLKEIKTFGADVIHLHAPNIWASLAVWLRADDTPLIVTHHCDIVGREPIRSAVMMLYRRLVRRAQRVIVTQPNNFTCSEDLRPTAVQPTVAPYCVEPSTFEADPDFQRQAQAIRRERFADAPVAVFVGRLVPYKGADKMIEALAKVSDLHVIVVGDGPERQALEYQARDLGVADRLHILGSTDERTKHVWLCASDFLILPSVTIAEAFGIVQVEAMLWSKPVLTTDLPSGVPQVGQDEVTSLVVPPGDVLALAAAMQRLVGSPDLRHCLGAAGRARALDLYGVNRFTRTFLGIYADAMPKTSASASTTR